MNGLLVFCKKLREGFVICATEQADLARYLYDVALLQQGMLRGEALTEFVEKTLGRL